MKVMLKRMSVLIVFSTVFLALYAQDKNFRWVRSEYNGVFFTPPASEEYAGDPMPFYDETNKLFRLFYLRDRRPGSNKGDNGVNYHPISQVTTADAIHYREIKDGAPILPYGEDDPAFGTGSVIKDDNNGEYVLFYTGHKFDNEARQNREVVLRAYSTDGVNWNKNVMRNETEKWNILPPDGYSKADFRDPCVVKVADGDYRMLVSAINGEGRAVLVEYKSAGLWDWELVGDFKTDAEGHFYECTDVFRMGGLWYLLYSDMDGSERCVKYYVAETYEGLKTAAKPYRMEGMLDGKSFYAGKTASDGEKRYIWGWCGTRNGQEASEADQDWAGSLVCHQVIQKQEKDHANLTSLGVKRPDGFKEEIKKEIFWHEDYTSTPGTVRHMDKRLYPTNKITFTVRGAKDKTFGIRFIDCPDHDSYSVKVVGGENPVVRFVKDAKEGAGEVVINEMPLLKSDVDDWFETTGYDITVITDNRLCVFYINDAYAFTNRIYGIEGNPWALFYESGSGEIQVSNLKVYTTETSDVIWNGEDREIGSQGGLWDLNKPVVVENPDKTGINTSDRCLKYTAKGRQQIQIPLRDWLHDFNMKGARRLSFMIKKPTEGNVVMELSDPTNSSEGYWAKALAWYGKPGEWQKVVLDFTDNTVVNDYPGVISIFASFDEKPADEDIYIDNVVLELRPTVGGAYVGYCKDKGLKDRIVLGGSWMRGECINFTDFGGVNWDKKSYYDDYAILQNKLTKGVYEADMRGVVSVHGIYDNNIAKVNPNCIIYATEDTKPLVAEGKTADNVVVGDVDAGHADRFVIDEGYPFYCTEDFTASEGTVKRRMVKDHWNTMVLPFFIQDDGEGYLGGQYARLKGERRDAEGNVIMEFTTFEKFFDANVPFLVKATDTNVDGDGYNEFVFQNIKVCKTPELINCRPEGTFVDFIGTYSYTGEDYDKAMTLPVGSYFIYNDTFKHVVKEGANTMKPLRGYFEVYDKPASSKLGFTVDDTPTDIVGIDAGGHYGDDNWYTLQGIRIAKPQQKGLYINKGRVVSVK